MISWNWFAFHKKSVWVTKMFDKQSRLEPTVWIMDFNWMFMLVKMQMKLWCQQALLIFQLMKNPILHVASSGMKSEKFCLFSSFVIKTNSVSPVVFHHETIQYAAPLGSYLAISFHAAFNIHSNKSGARSSSDVALLPSLFSFHTKLFKLRN